MALSSTIFTQILEWFMSKNDSQQKVYYLYLIRKNSFL